MIFTLLQSCQLLTITEEADWTASFVLGRACGMWVWEPSAKLVPSMDRSCPSHEEVKKYNLSTLPWHWTQNPHRLVCSEGLLSLCIKGVLRHCCRQTERTHTEQNFLHVFMLKLVHPHLPASWDGLLGCHHCPHHYWLTECLFSRCSLESRLFAKHLQTKPPKLPMDGCYTFSKEVCDPSASLFFHGLTVGYLVFPCISQLCFYTVNDSSCDFPIKHISVEPVSLSKPYCYRCQIVAFYYACNGKILVLVLNQ